jgi:cell division protein FtsI (penicillin-binding protein 3)
VFKEIADKLYALTADKDNNIQQFTIKKDSSNYNYAGASEDMKEVMKKLKMKYLDSARDEEEWSRLYAVNYHPVLNVQPVRQGAMPDIRGMGLKDVLYLLENRQMKVIVRGKGKVSVQSIEPGAPVAKHQTVIIELN